MSFLFCDNYNHYRTAAELAQVYTLGGSPALSTTQVRWTGKQVVNMAGAGQFIHRTGFTARATTILGFAYYAAANPASAGAVASVADGTSNQVTLQVNTDGSLQFMRGGSTLIGSATAAGAMPTSQWVWVEIKIKVDPTVGTAEVKINGVSKIALTGQNTRSTANSSANGYKLACAGANSTFVTDTVFFDDQGSVGNDFPGDTRVETIVPTAAGNSTMFTPSTGSNWQCVDETPANQTDYVESSAANDIDLYGMSNLTPTSGTAHGIVVGVYTQKTDAGSNSIRQLVRTNSTNYDPGADVAISSTFTYYNWAMENNPDTSARWNISEINGMEAGVKRTV